VDIYRLFLLRASILSTIFQLNRYRWIPFLDLPGSLECLTKITVGYSSFTEFTPQEFEQFCADKRVAFSFAPPKHQEGNHFVKRTWQSLRKLAQSMLVHARLPDMYLYHALLHSCNMAFRIAPDVAFIYLWSGPGHASPCNIKYGQMLLVRDFLHFYFPIVPEYIPPNGIFCRNFGGLLFTKDYKC
jgi:hypothetical protein